MRALVINDMIKKYERKFKFRKLPNYVHSSITASLIAILNSSITNAQADQPPFHLETIIIRKSI